MTEKRRTALFFGEGATLSHVVRPAVLASHLDRQVYRPILACSSPYETLVEDLDLERVPLESIDPKVARERLFRGDPLFDVETLDRYVAQDLELIERVKPDVVIGDLRLSLAVSARLAGVPLITLVNAHWSPYGESGFELAEHPMIDFLGQPLAQTLFQIFKPVGLALQSLPLNVVRTKYGVAGWDADVRHSFTAGDIVLYPDVPELVPTEGLPDHHSYLGPVPWSPKVDLPDWWTEVDDSQPVIYLNLGSSGASSRLRSLLDALAELPVQVMAATAGRRRLLRPPANVFLADFLPGDRACARASLCICNGGATAAQQSLAAGTPVLGIVSNMDQLLFAKAVHGAGAGEWLREGEVTASVFQDRVKKLLEEAHYRAAAVRLQQAIEKYDAAALFRQALDRACGVKTAAGSTGEGKSG
ncbi:MAG: glycosyl transferase family 1 [Deltaproteobacteria bacterium]|nr:glycosyl transferase family 1 [Deltaproteobacteria bacterium]